MPFCEFDNVPGCVPEGGLRGLSPGEWFYARFSVNLYGLTGGSYFLRFGTNRDSQTDYVRTTCVDNASADAGVSCTKWEIEAKDSTNPNNSVGAVAKLINFTTDTDIGLFRMPFKITACLKEYYSGCVPVS